MIDPSSLGARDLAAALGRGELRAIDVTEACLERIAAGEPQLHAWVHLDADYARRQARALDAGSVRGVLHGLPIGVKDIFETSELPTEYGTPIYRGHRPAADAACVALARAAGAVVLGKTATAELAVYSPAATVNPHNPAHTPGGSSSGSAAAVADGMVPLAFGTQTAGSIIRPASFCGVIGYKPTYGAIARAGVKLLAESLDTVGVFARTVADAALLVGALTGRDDLRKLRRPSGRLAIGFCRTHEWKHVEHEARAVLEDRARRLAEQGAQVCFVDLPDDFAGLSEAQAMIFGYEAVRNLAHERRAHAEQLTAHLRAELDAGVAVTASRYDAAQQLARVCRRSFLEVMGDCDVLIAPSATGEAPAGLESTGNPIMSRAWTLLHVPCVNVPCGPGPRGLPLGLQIIGCRGEDARTLSAAAWIHEQLAA
jgi:Asp-tRNA(Asn)/Glu-tRNA(Gln) amidotransferase A subunit family amidase